MCYSPLYSQLKSNDNYNDHQGRILLAGDVYSCRETQEVYYHVYFFMPEFYRFVWLEWDNYQLLVALSPAERQSYIEQHWQNHFVELDRVFRFPLEANYTYEGNLFITPEKFTHLFT